MTRLKAQYPSSKLVSQASQQLQNSFKTVTQQKYLSFGRPMTEQNDSCGTLLILLHNPKYFIQ